MMWWLAQVLRDNGLIVEEVSGWQDRGHGDVIPEVVVNHHTAGGPNGRAPSLATCIYGVPGVPGPLCNVMQTREESGPDRFIVIAAGNSYNAGTGGWAGFTGNMYTIGLEVEHTGVEHYPEHRREFTWRFNAAVLNAIQRGSDRACQHFEWSNAGKIDIAQGVDPDYWRQKIGEYQNVAVPPPGDLGEAISSTLRRRKGFKMIRFGKQLDGTDRCFYWNGSIIEIEFTGPAGYLGLPQSMWDFAKNDIVLRVIDPWTLARLDNVTKKVLA